MSPNNINCLGNHFWSVAYKIGFGISRAWYKFYVSENGDPNHLRHAAENISSCGFQIATKFRQVYLVRPMQSSMEFCSLATVAMVTVAKEQNSIDDCIGLTKIHFLSKFGGNSKTTGWDIFRSVLFGPVAREPSPGYRGIWWKKNSRNYSQMPILVTLYVFGRP